jgi:hypothetical protein
MTIAELTELRDAWKAAYIATAGGVSYTINTGGTSRSLTRADATTCRTEYQYWQNQLDIANGETRRVKFGVASLG